MPRTFVRFGRAASQELVAAVRDLNAVVQVLFEAANSFDECAAALGAEVSVDSLWRTATLARTAAFELSLSMVGVDPRSHLRPAARSVPPGPALPGEPSPFLRFACGPAVDGARGAR
jgi:hypothetical protein